MFIVTDLGEQIMREIDASSRIAAVRSLNLNPPGGYIGKLPQTQVEYDAIEAADATVPASGLSLLINLNRIRAGDALGNGIILARHLSSGLIIPTVATITVQGDDGTPSYSDIDTIRFTDSSITLVDANTAEVSILSGFLANVSLVGSGYVTRSWYLDGALVSGIENPDRLYYLPHGAVTSKVITVSPTPGTTDATIFLVYSEDGTAWTTYKEVVHPSGTVYNTEDFYVALPSGALLGVTIGSVPIIPADDPFWDMTVILQTSEMQATGNELPTFTPKRVPYADNTTGLLTEDTRFNFLTDNSSSVLVIGADDYIHIGGYPEKVALDIVRDGKDGGLIMETYDDGTYAPSVVGMRARGTRASPAGLLTGDILFRFTGRGYTVSGWSLAPSFSLKGVANEDWGELNYGAKAVIAVTKNGEATSTDMMTITGDGLEVLGYMKGTTLAVSEGAVSGYVLTATDGVGNAEWRTGGGGVSAFTSLTDVPNTYTGAANYKVKVKGDETGLEFVTDTGATQTKYEPDVASGSTEFDDEFDAITLGEKWIPSNTYDDAFDLFQNAGGSLHLSTTYRVGYLTFQGPFGWQQGIYQSFSPEDDNWTLVCKVNAGYYPNQADSMFCMGINGVDQDHMLDVRVGYSSVTGIRVTLCDNGSDYVYWELPFDINGAVYLMLSKVYNDPDTFYYVHASNDGINWIPVVSDINATSLTTATITKQYFGCFNVVKDGIHSVDFVRYFNSAFQANIGSNP